MRYRIAACCLILVVAQSVVAAERWWDSYNRGVAAVNANNHRVALDALGKAIAEMPAESTAARAGNKIITYVPHFYIGIAKFNLGDVDGALRSWRTSEEQGAIARTEYYARLKEWVARANTELQRRAQKNAAGAKQAADSAISKALATQVDALSAGGDRTDSYRSAQRKLDQALAEFNKAGTDVAIYRAAEKSATQASNQFAAAAEEGKKLRAARPVTPPARPTVTQDPADVSVVVIEEKKKPVAEAPPPVESEAKVAAALAVQRFRRSVIDAAGKSRLVTVQEFLKAEARQADELRGRLERASTDAEFLEIGKVATDREAGIAKQVAALRATPAVTPAEAPVTATVPPAVVPTAPAQANRLREAWVAYASGKLEDSERVLDQLIAAEATGEAYLLRGCTRYTRATLSRKPEALLAAATDDFRAALQKKASLKLDRALFSPKLVAFFENVKRTR